MDKDIRKEIDKRNEFCSTVHTKPDTIDFVFEDYCDQTVKMAKSIDYVDGIFAALIIVITRHIAFGNYEESYNRLQNLIKEYKLEDVKAINQMKYYGVLVLFYAEYKEEIEKAVLYSKKEMELAESIDDQKEVMRIKMNIGALNIDLGYYETAISFINEACDYYESTNNYVLLCYCYLNLGEVYYAMDNYTEAKEFLMKSIDLAKQENEISIQYSATHISGLVAIKDNNYEEALLYIEKALNMSRQSKSIKAELKVNLDLIEVLILMEKYNEAYDEIIVIEEELTNSEKKENIKRFYKNKAIIHEKLGDLTNAYVELSKYTKYLEAEKPIKSSQSMNKLIQEEYKKNINRLETIAKVGRELTTLSDIDEVLVRVRNELVKVLEVDILGIGEICGEELCFNHYFVGDKKVKAKNIPLSNKTSLANWCIENKKEVIINDLDTEYIQYTNNIIRMKASATSDDGFVQSLMYAPLQVNDEIIGVLTIQSAKKNVYTSEEINVFKIITDYVSIAVKNVSQRIELERLSERDTLTMMYNRRGFIDYYNQHMIDGFSNVNSIAIIMLDLDYFKSINDNYGHLVGDDVLVIVARCLMDKESRNIRSGRLGGEEFGLILINKEKSEVLRIAEQIRQDIEKLEFPLKDAYIKITTSVGVSYNKNLMDLSYNKIYFEADKALYYAKKSGRNMVKVYKN